MEDLYQALYAFEYSILPRFIASYMRGGKSIALIEEKGRLDMICRLSMSNLAPLIKWDEVQIERHGEPEAGCIICYTFPTPFRMPLAKYGVAYINTTIGKSAYYTLEKSVSDFVMGSMTEDGMHFNFGDRPDMSKEEFIKEVYGMEKISVPSNNLSNESAAQSSDNDNLQKKQNMKRAKIDFGIDLGTTNSAICKMEKGVPTIIKSDTLKDTMPSCVSFNKRKSVKAGDGAYNDMKIDKRRAIRNSSATANSFVEFKRKMGTSERMYSSFMDYNYSAEELSAEVLKTLKSFVLDEDVRSVVITVPAKFTQNQKDATMRAAQLAGFEHCELLQEPIAASMAYGLSATEKDGLWLVFDFGGGTFDAALIKSKDGILQVFDTEGDNYLGGKNLDEAIVDQIIIPYLSSNYEIGSILADPDRKQVLREAMKTYAEEAKNQLSFRPSEDIISNIGDLGGDDNDEEIELDITITQETLRKVVEPVFQRAVDICKRLLERNNLSGNRLTKVILVGGPTHSPILRQMLREQISPNVDTSVDPMTVVATGAALYASTLDSKAQVQKEMGTVYLDVKYESTSVDTTEFVSIKLDKEQSASFDSIFVELNRADKAWSSGKHEITEIGDVIDVELLEGKSNSFVLSAYDKHGTTIPCFPSEITIIQGTVVGKAPLGYNIALERWDIINEMGVIAPFVGLEKNKPIPAVGTINGLKTTSTLRPGHADDVVKIPIYEGDDGSNGKRAALYNHTYTVNITGEMVPALLPENSDVDLTLRVNSDSDWVLQAYFPALEHTVEIRIPKETVQDVSIDYLQDEFSKADVALKKLKREGCTTEEEEKSLADARQEFDNGSEKHQVLAHLREALRKIEDLENASEWERIEKQLRSQFKMLEGDNQRYGNADTTKQVEEIRSEVDGIIRKKNIDLAKAEIDKINALSYQIARIEYYIAWIRRWYHDFNNIQWKDSTRARMLISNGMTLISSGPTTEQLEPIVAQLSALAPATEIPEGAEGLLK